MAKVTKNDLAPSVPPNTNAPGSDFVMEEGRAPCNESQFIRAIEQSFAMYKKYGSRSPRKLEPLHGYIAGVLGGIWGADFQIHRMATSIVAAPFNVVEKEKTVAVPSRRG
jgi:hypothetical protein